MTPEYIPLKHFSDCISAGWKMVTGFPLHPGDYAVLMVPPSPKKKPTKYAGYESREYLRKSQLRQSDTEPDSSV